MISKPAALENRVLRHIRQAHLFVPPCGVVVACSGGADSLCLLAILHHWRGKLGLELAAAWFDHGLRSTRVERERKLVENYARRFAIPLHTGTGDTRRHASEQNMSIEEAARDLRYRFLGETCRNIGYSTIATGHTADDNAETILLHILRGCGIDGLTGILPIVPLPIAGSDYPVIQLERPLLTLGRGDTEAYCTLNKMKYALDPSNRSPRFLRNRVRLQLLPLLEKLNPAVRRNLLRLSKAASEAHAALSEIVACLPHPTLAEDGTVELSRKEIAGMLPAIRSAYLREALRLLIPGLKDINAYHVRLLASLATGSGGRTLNLPGGITASAHSGTIFIRHADTLVNIPCSDITFAVPGSTCYREWEITASLIPPPRGKPSPGRACFDADTVGNTLVVGPWRTGERLQPLGMPGEKKLQDIFTDAKIARPLREKLPVIRSKDRTLWIPGVRQAEWARVKADTRSILLLTCRPIN